MDFLEGLNDAQRKAVEHTEGPVMVIAGAGSGKTRVLTFRIAHLLTKGVDSFRILSLTFTNKAAREMKNRIGRIVGEGEARNLWMGTFHSIFAKILRFEADKIGYPSNFTIYDTDDSKNLVKLIVKEMNLDDKVYKANLVFNRISAAKNNLLSAAAYNQNSSIYTEDAQAKRPMIGKIYEQYEKRCFRSGAMDFDDLLFKTNILLRDHADVLFKYQEKFRYILVDEFQDTNLAQYLILKQLAARYENICVVGDDAQSIYAFRGANIQNILNFKKEYPDTGVYKLEQNYRSTENIVQAANSIIEKNRDQLKKEVWTQNDAGDRIKVLAALTDNEEGLNVAHRIFDLKQHHHATENDFAILYRTNAQSRAMEEALRKLGIPYKIYGGLSFYQRKEIKDLLAYFRLTVNPQDEEALRRVINYPARGIGKTTMDRLFVAASEHNQSLWEVMTRLDQFPVKINGPTRERIGNFVTLIRGFQLMAEKEAAYDAGHKIASSTGILKELYADRTPEGISRYENIQELLNGLKDFSERDTDQAKPPQLAEFLQEVSLLTDQDVKDGQEKDDDKEKVTLMTVHSAKGLEFPFVFVVGLEENLFPSQLSLHSRTDLEEERRLFYVAITRAKTALTLSYAASRYRWGNLIHCEPSRFIEEIDTKFLDTASTSTNPMRPANRPTTAAATQAPPRRKLTPVRTAPQSNSDFVPDDTRNLQTGMEVMHERFGQGKVISMEGQFPDQKATVFFPKAGQKQLLLKFAKLKIVG